MGISTSSDSRSQTLSLGLHSTERLSMALLSQGWPYSHLCMRILSPTVELLFQESTYSVSLITKDHYNSICPFKIFPCNSQPQSIPTVLKTEGLL